MRYTLSLSLSVELCLPRGSSSCPSRVTQSTQAASHASESDDSFDVDRHVVTYVYPTGFRWKYKFSLRGNFRELNEEWIDRQITTLACNLNIAEHSFDHIMVFHIFLNYTNPIFHLISSMLIKYSFFYKAFSMRKYFEQILLLRRESFVENWKFN